jgi:hypothetical protein
VLRYNKTILGGHISKNSREIFSKLDFHNDDLQCCVRYSNVEYQAENFKNYHQK